MIRVASIFLVLTAAAASAATRPLTADELARAKAKIGETLDARQSFRTTLRPVGDVWFLSEALLPPESFRYHVWKDGKEVAVFAPDPDISSWSADHLDAVTFKDFDGDGIDDVGVVASYLTGIGPTGAQPFPVAEIYRGDGKGGFHHDAAWAKKLEKAKVKTMKDLLRLAKSGK